MKILFVRPRPSSETIGLQHVMLVEPLELEVLAALMRQHDESFLADLIIEKKPLSYFLEKHRPEVVCFTAYITHVGLVIDYGGMVKRHNPHATTIVGGVHCEVCPDDFDNPAIDFRMVRNAVKGFPALLGHIENGDPLPAGVLRSGQAYDPASMPAHHFGVPFPDRRLTARHRKKYFYIFHNKVALIKTSFGCPYSCSFCFCIRITGGKYWQRPVDQVLEELATIDEKEVYIVDDDFLIDRLRIEAFIKGCRARSINKHFLVYGRADFIAANPQLMEAFRDAGLRTVIVGLESFASSELDSYNKQLSPETNRQAMDILNRLGIDCFATIIVPPHWDRKDFRQMTANLVGLGVHFVNLQPLTPLPGTGMVYPDEQMLISTNDYEKWDLAHLVLKPTRLSEAAFYREMLRAYEKILFQRRFLLRHLRRYPPHMLLKMIRGVRRVRKQYLEKIRKACEPEKPMKSSTPQPSHA